MKKIIPFFIMICCLLAVSSCSYDNFEEPKATLTGKAIYDGEAVGVGLSWGTGYFELDENVVISDLVEI